MARGEWMDGRSAEALPARLAVEDGVLVVRSEATGETVARWPVRDVHVDALHEGEVVHLEYRGDPDAHVSTRDPSLVRTIQAGGATSRTLPKGMRLRVAALSSAVSVAALLGGFYFAAPWLSRVVANAIPPEVERSFAPRVGGIFEKQTCDTTEARDAIREMLSRLDPDKQIEAEVRLVNVDMPNAFALPGGVVVLTKGLVEQAASPEEVAGVLAHELAHVKHRHVLAHLIRDAFLGAVWALTLGDYSGLLVVDPSTAYNIAMLRHSRSDEAEADATALALLDEHRVSSQGLIDFFERHGGKEDSETSWLSTHPSTEERVAALTSAARTRPAEPVMNRERFYRFRTACDGTKPVYALRDLFF